jgi:DEAD/DEAH box helicase domain-containing protein
LGIDVGEIDVTLHLGFPGSIARCLPFFSDILTCLFNSASFFWFPFYFPINILYFSLWQQAGRGGRRDRPSLAIYVAFGGPLDQYFMKNPRKLFERPIECCHIDSQNKQVLNF